MVRRLRPAGFTLLELLLALSIATLLGVLSISTYTSLSGALGAATHEAELRRIIRFTRSAAVAQQRVVTLCVIGEDGQCLRNWGDGRTLLSFVDSDRNRAWSTEEAVLLRQAWPVSKGSLRWRASLGRYWLSILPSGRTHENGNLTWCPASREQRHARRLTISKTGRIYGSVDSDGDGQHEGRDGATLTCG